MVVEQPGIEDVRAAADRLRGIAVHTPLVALHHFGAPSGIFLKPEIHQPITSFKIRGVFNAVSVLSPEQRARGLSTVSAGNTAQALAWVGRHFGVTSRSLMPDNAPKTKVEAVKRYGGTPVLVPTADVFRFLKEHQWEKEPFAFIHPWTCRDVMIGHGTMGLEIIADLPDVDSVYLPVGGGGLMGGVGSVIKALNPSVRLVAVEPEGCPALHESLRLGKPTSVECNTICDGVAVPYITDEVFPLLRDLVDEVILVSEDAVRATIRRLALGNRMIVEGAGALSVAAALDTPEAKRGKTVCVVTGGSIDTAKLAELLNDGAA